ncbi:MAG: glycine--tRNA ligase subunit beta [Caldilineaceae bacterium]
MSTPPSMQQVIMRLHEYWAAHGCLIGQPYSEKVGAGTYNPATVLRVLGPEPWNVAYVEPSFRADDGRYAENPNRMQMHHQYQVILKPDPGNPQELYLGSLEAIGLERAKHDIRFVEDNWRSPALGAWGLGWEVWLDGQEITQFTYFQQSGGLALDPVSVEITYGLDRIVMYLQNKTQVWDIDVDGVHRFDEIYRDAEVENCVYNYELADVERLKQLFDIYKAEADACIKRGLVIPAHDYVLRQSQTFNLLDARGAIGVTERAKYFASMRNQARSVAELYVKQRERAEYPWLKEDQRAESRDQRPVTATNLRSPISGLQSPVSNPQSFLLELGSEELPPSDVTSGLAQIEENLAKLLKEQRLAYDQLRVTGTTRRLVAYVTGLAPRQADEIQEKRGPTLDRAFDTLGQPTKAAEGFAKGQGVDVGALEKRDNYVYAVKRVAGRATTEVLPAICQALLDGLRFEMTMRWNSSNIAYPRPLRWIVALYGNAVIPFTWAGVASGNSSRGPRFADAVAHLPAGEFTTFTVADADSYFKAVAEQGILVDRTARRQRVGELVQQTAASVHGVTTDEPELLDEVTDLVETPQALLGSFEAKYLELPMPVLIGVMKKHQRYFPVLQQAGSTGQGAGQASAPATHHSPPAMLPYFITIANAKDLAHPKVVVAGNEGVIRARYADAAYFYRQDTARSLESYTPRLSTLTFHEKLGSMLNKVERLKTLAPQIAQMIKASPAQVTDATRAAALAKSDLVTSMVVEMTSLQGVMGEIYALKSGEPAAVAQAIREHYLPRAAGDANPASAPGLALSLADKLDSLSGLFAVGAIPTGSADPFGLRRAALGVVNNLLATQTDFSVKAGLAVAATLQPVTVTPEALNETATFITRRLQGVLLEMGYAYDVVEAVLAVRGDNPYAAQRACAALSELVRQPWWADAFVAYARCARITRNLDGLLPLNVGAYAETVEQQLHDAYTVAQTALNSSGQPAAILGTQLHALQGPINAYFEKVLVNAEDETVRKARLALVQRIAALPAAVADLSKLQGF